MRKVLYFMAWHILTQGRYRAYKVKFRIEAKARRSQLNFEGFDMVCRANGFIDGFIVFCACIEVHVYVPTSSQPAQPSPASYIEKVLVRGLFTTESVLVCSSQYNTETDMHTCFSSSVSTCNQVFQQALFGVLPGIFLSLSFFLSAARSLYLALAPSLCSFITSRLPGPCFLS